MKENNNINNSVIATYFKNGLFAGLASATSIFTYPLEVLKIRSQVLENKIKSRQLITTMLREEGFRSFFKGLNQNLLQGFIGYGSVFFFYKIFYEKMNLHSRNKETINTIISSTAAGLIAVVIASPFNFVKTRLILYKGNSFTGSHNMLYIIKDIYLEKKSIIGFWKALNPSIITSFYSAIQISMYQVLKNKFNASDNLKLNSFFGLVSRCVAAAVIFPFSLLRSRMLNFRTERMSQSLNSNEVFYKTEHEYKKIIKDIYTIIRREGYTSVFRGLKFELIKVSINGALFFYIYELLNQKFSAR